MSSNQNSARPRLTVIGLGYIGLPTAVMFAKHGWQVAGVDVSLRVTDLINQGRLPFVEEGLEEELALAVQDGHLLAQNATPESDIYIVSVPTPFADDHRADLSYIESAADGISAQLRGDELIVLESTSPPGTTEHMANRILAARPDLSLDGSGNRPIIHFAHAPERVLPGRIMIELTQNDRVIGGITTVAAKKAKKVYSTFCVGEISLTDARTAEMAKLTENAFRDVNIAFANELSLIADNLDIDVWELIELANKHPRVNVLNPGPGVGGHCIAVDPWFIVAADPQNSRLIKVAREVNDHKPQWVINQVNRAVDTANGTVKRIAILGLSFKPNIDDLRESPAIHIAELLIEQGNAIEFLISEPNISVLPPSLITFGNATLVDTDTAVAQADLVLLLVGHNEYGDLWTDKLDLLLSKSVLDTVGLWKGHPGVLPLGKAR